MTPETAAVATLPADRGTEALRSLERSIGAGQSVIDRLAGFRTSLLHRLLCKGTGHTAFTSSPLGNIPASWEVRSLGEIAILTSGKTKPKDASHVRSASHSVPIYGANGLLGFTGAPLHRGNTIVIGRIGARCGAVRFVSDEACWITDNALFIYETRPQIDLRFLSYSLFHANLASLRNMGRQPLISLATIYPVLLAVPPLAEQREISDVLLSLEALGEAQEKVLGQMKRLWTALRTGEGDDADAYPGRGLTHSPNAYPRNRFLQ